MKHQKVLAASTAFFASLLFAPTKQADAQIGIGINIGAPPPCAWGYYDFAPYACAPRGFYGPGYFYNGIFLGVGPWENWGYAHGWDDHRFRGPGGGRYHYGRGWQEDPHRGGYGRDRNYGHDHGDRRDGGGYGDRGDHGHGGYGDHENHGGHGGPH
jgi:hypothetical protein